MSPAGPWEASWAEWGGFFQAAAGAAAALAGLLFVAVSINLERILSIRHLPIRSAETLLALLEVLFIACLALVPGLSPAGYGLAIGATGLACWLGQTAALLASSSAADSGSGRGAVLRAYFNLIPSRRRLILRLFFNQVPSLPFIVAGALLWAGRPEGLYWTVPGVLLCFAAGVFGAWVLLIEIQR